MSASRSTVTHVHFWLVTASFSSSVAWTTAEMTGVSGVAAGVGSWEQKRSSLSSHTVSGPQQRPPTRVCGPSSQDRSPSTSSARPWTLLKVVPRTQILHSVNSLIPFPDGLLLGWSGGVSNRGFKKKKKIRSVCLGYHRTSCSFTLKKIRKFTYWHFYVLQLLCYVHTGLWGL